GFYESGERNMSTSKFALDVYLMLNLNLSRWRNCLRKSINITDLLPLAPSKSHTFPSSPLKGMFQPSMKFDAPAYCSAPNFISSHKTKSPTLQATSNLTRCTLAPITSLITSITSSSPTNEIMNNSNTMFPIVSCQSSASSNGKNKRGRKPLPTMPSEKRHFRNLVNQRAFRERKKTYVRDLETKASKFEALYTESLTEIKSLKERVALLEKFIASNNMNDAADGYMVEDNHPNENRLPQEIYKRKENVSYTMSTVSDQYSSYPSTSGNCNLLSFPPSTTSTYILNDVRQRQRSNQQLEEPFQNSLQSDTINNPTPAYGPRSPTHSSSSIETMESGESNGSAVTLNGLSNPMTTSTSFYSIFSNEQKSYWIPTLPAASNDEESAWQKLDQQRWRSLASTLPPHLQYDVNRGS
ncbi:9286_t:CDS:2, partial [Racocetra persica]